MGIRFNHRSQEQELMDDLNCCGEIINQTLKELEVINRWLGGNSVTIDGISKLLKNFSAGQPVTIIDIGCGGGDMLNLIAKWARRKAIKVELTGIDANPNIIDFASHNSKQFPEINYQVMDIFSDKFKMLNSDIIISTLFTHHFDDTSLANLMNEISSQARVGVVINDLHRHRIAYHSIKILTKLFSKSKMVQYDGPLSVLRAFSKDDIRQILSAAGIDQYSLRWMWAFRWQIIIPTPGAKI